MNYFGDWYYFLEPNVEAALQIKKELCSVFILTNQMGRIFSVTSTSVRRISRNKQKCSSPGIAKKKKANAFNNPRNTSNKSPVPFLSARIIKNPSFPTETMEKTKETDRFSRPMRPFVDAAARGPRPFAREKPSEEKPAAGEEKKSRKSAEERRSYLNSK